MPDLVVQTDPDAVEEGEAQGPPRLVAGGLEHLPAASKELQCRIQALASRVELQAQLIDLFLRRRPDLPQPLLLLLEQRYRHGVGVVGLEQLPLLSFGLLKPELLLGDDPLLPATHQLDQLDDLMLDGVQVLGLRLKRLHQVEDLGLHLLNRKVGQGAAVLAVPVTAEAEEVRVVATLPLRHQQAEA